MRDKIYQQARVLIIDDEESTADVLCHLLEREGYQQVERTLDPREAIAHYTRVKPDLVILDWMMPQLSGLEVLRQLRAHTAGETYLPILVLTALAQEEVKLAALANGATDCLTKPYNPSEIALRVGTVLATRFLHLELEKQTRLLESRVVDRTAALTSANAALEAGSVVREGLKDSALQITGEWEQSLDAVPDQVCILSLEGKIVRANRTMREQFEPVHGPLAGLDYRLCYCGTATPKEQPHCADVLKNGRPVFWEGKLSTLDGWFSMAGYPLFDEAGKQWGAVSVVRDLTARKAAQETLREAHEETEERVRAQTGELVHANRDLATETTGRRHAEDELRFSEENLKTAIRGADLGTWDWDIGRQKVTCCARTEEMFGLAAGAGTTLDNLVATIHPDDKEAMTSALNRAAESGEPCDVQYRVVWPDGTLRWIAALGAVRGDADGKRAHMAGTMQDITRRKAVDEALRKSDRKLSLAIAGADLGPWEWDIAADKLSWSDRKKAMFGLPADTVMTYEVFLDAIHPGDREFADAALKRAVAGGTQYDVETRTIWPDGTVHWVAARSRVTYDESGKAVSMDGIAQDITARKHAEVQSLLRTAQQSAVAVLGQGALLPTDLHTLFNAAVTLVAKTLGIEYVKVLELQPEKQSLFLRAGVGWKEGHVGRSSEGTGRESQAGFTLLSNDPVISEDLRTETRFSSPPLWHEHGVVSAMTVIIGGLDHPFGVLGACSREKHLFAAEDDRQYARRRHRTDIGRCHPHRSKRRSRTGKRGQERISLTDEPRAAHAIEPHPRVCAGGRVRCQDRSPARKC